MLGRLWKTSTILGLPCQERHALAAVDVIVSIADLLESDHGWSIEQSEAWLHRIGL